MLQTHLLVGLHQFGDRDHDNLLGYEFIILSKLSVRVGNHPH